MTAPKVWPVFVVYVLAFVAIVAFTIVAAVALHVLYPDIAEAELFAQLDPVGFLNQERVRSAVDHEPVDFFAEDDSAGPRRSFEQHERHSASRQLVCRGEAGDAAADDDAI